MEGVSTDVAGTAIGVEVRDSEHVRQGQVLYRHKPETYRIALGGAQLDTVRDKGEVGWNARALSRKGRGLPSANWHRGTRLASREMHA